MRSRNLLEPDNATANILQQLVFAIEHGAIQLDKDENNWGEFEFWLQKVAKEPTFIKPTVIHQKNMHPELLDQACMLLENIRVSAQNRSQ